MAELISMTYEEARAEHFKALKDEAKRKMNYWATRVRRSRPNDLNDPAHIKASEYGAEYSYYKDALEALENQPKWISVEERLPEDGAFAIFYYVKNEKNMMAVGCYFDYGMFIVDGHSVNVTHWMALPQPPKEEE